MNYTEGWGKCGSVEVTGVKVTSLEIDFTQRGKSHFHTSTPPHLHT
jgi:hypothetical protein